MFHTNLCKSQNYKDDEDDGKGAKEKKDGTSGGKGGGPQEGNANNNQNRDVGETVPTSGSKDPPK